MKDPKKTVRPIYKTVYSVEEALYESPDAKEPICSRRMQGRFSIDLVRAALLGALAAVTATALAVAMACDHGDRND